MTAKSKHTITLVLLWFCVYLAVGLVNGKRREPSANQTLNQTKYVFGFGFGIRHHHTSRILHTANCLATSRKVEDCSFLATRCIASCKEGMPHVQCSPATCLATLSRCKLQGCCLRICQSGRIRLERNKLWSLV